MALPKAKGRQLFVFGDMGDIEQAKVFHQQVAADAKASGIEQLFCYGDLTQYTAEAFGAGAQHFKNKDV